MTLPALGPQRQNFLAWLQIQAGKPCLWGRKGPDAFDCSGLVTAGYQAAGLELFDPEYTNTDKLWNELPHVSLTQIQLGDLVFYGGARPNDVSHVMVWWGGGRVFGACGASSRILTIQAAIQGGHKVRTRGIGYRGDYRGLRASPLDLEPISELTA